MILNDPILGISSYILVHLGTSEYIIHLDTKMRQGLVKSVASLQRFAGCDLRENLQETIDFPMKNGTFL